MSRQDDVLRDITAELGVITHRLQDYLSLLRTVPAEDQTDEAAGIAATSLLVMVTGAVTLGQSSIRALLDSNEMVKERKSA